MRVGNLSTLLWGSEDEVFAALRAAFRAAQQSRPGGADGHLRRRHAHRRAGGRDPGRRGGRTGSPSTVLDRRSARHARSRIGPRGRWSWRRCWPSPSASSSGPGDCCGRASFRLIPFPFSYALVGVWMVGGLLVPYVVRASRRGPARRAGGRVRQHGHGQPVGHPHHGQRSRAGRWAPRSVFAAGRWKRFDGVWLYGAAALAGAFSILLDTFVYSYYATYTWGSILVAGILCVVSSVVLGGGLSQALGQALAADGRPLRAGRRAESEPAEDLITATPSPAVASAAGPLLHLRDPERPGARRPDLRVSGRARPCWCSVPAARARARSPCAWTG